MGKKKQKKTDIHRHLDSSENNLKGSTQKYHWRRLSFQNSREISITQGTEILLCKIICGDMHLINQTSLFTSSTT